MQRLSFVACVAMVAASATLQVSGVTLTWTGGANNNLWCDADNWDSGGETIDFTAVNDYVIEDLPDGTTLTVSANIKVNSLTMKTNAVANATWAIDGSGTIRYSDNGALVVPKGCTLNLAVEGKNPWGAGNGYSLSGGGTLRHTKSWATWSRTLYVTSSTLVLAASSSGMDFTQICLSSDDATLRLEHDSSVSRVYSASGKSPTIDLNGHLLHVVFGATSGLISWTGDLIGTGTETFKLSGESVFTFSQSPTFNGIYDIWNAWCVMGTSESPTALPADAVVRISAGGKLQLQSSQTLAVIDGNAATGSIDIPSGAALTITGSNNVDTATTYGACLTGAGGLVKSGENHTLTLTGANTYTGPTRVEEGTLELKRDIPYDDGIVYHFRLDGNGYLKDSVRGIALTTANAPAQSAGDGAIGDCMTFDKDQKQRLVLAAADTSALSNRVYTISMWFRPTAASSGTLFCWGGGWNTESYKYRLAHVNVASATALGGYGNVSAPAPAGTTLTDGQWHHMVYTQEPFLKSVWIDGVRCGTYVPPEECVTDRGGIQFGGVDTWGFYSGSFDEIILANGTWSEARIKLEAARCRAANDIGNAADLLPQPIAKWTFDENYTDSVNGIALVSRGTGTPSLKTGSGALGKYAALASNSSLGLAEGAQFPECMPTGKMPFKVSIRYRQNGTQEYRHAFGWGDTSVASQFFAIGFTGSCRYNSVNWGNLDNGASWSLALGTTSRREAQCWEHIVVVYNGSTLNAYRDGVPSGTKSSVTLDIKAQDLFFGYRPNKNYYCPCDIDDVRVWDKSLTAAQVRALAQSLATGTVAPTLSATSAVTVDQGARLKVTGPGHEIGSLAGTGTVDIDSFSSLRVNGNVTFTDTLVGNGTLVLPSGANLSGVSAGNFWGVVLAEGGTVTLGSSFANSMLSVASGAKATGTARLVAVSDGYAVTTDGADTGLPVISATGRVVIPETGSVTFTSPPKAGFHVLMEGTSFDEPTDYSGWTVSGTGYSPRFMVDGGRFKLLLNGGVTIIIR